MAWMTKRKLRAEIVRLTYRVAELEERMCPTEQHDWVMVSCKYVPDGFDDLMTVYRYKCRRCGKGKEDIV